jgi:thiamine monophosphate synthase
MMPSLTGLLMLTPSQFGVQLFVALEALATPGMLVNGGLTLHTIEQVEAHLAKRIALVQDADMQRPPTGKPSRWR